MNFKKIIWSNFKKKPLNDTLYLSFDDVNHLERIWKKYKLTPESIEEVHIDFLADRHKLVRYIIKELDILLKVGGEFVINSTKTTYHGNYIRSLDQIKFEFSVSTNGRYSMKMKTNHKRHNSLVYSKKKNTLLQNDSIGKWSFGIITNGKKNKQVEDLIDSIVSQNIPDYEIIICGNFKSDKIPVIIIDDIIIDSEIRAPITIKKNKIVQRAKYENLMLLHDRYLLPDDWFRNMTSYGNYFDLLTFPNIGSKGGSVNDWGMHKGKPQQIGGFSQISHQLSYNTWSDDWYSQGGLLVIKKNLYNDIVLDNRLFWGELEDIQFSKIANLKGLFYYVDINNKIFTFSDRLKERNSNLFYKLGSLLYFIYKKFINYKNYMINLYNV